MTVSRVVTSQERFISLIDRLEETGNSQIKVLDSYKYFKNIFANKLKDFDFMIRDIFFVRDAIEGKEIIDAGCGSGTFSILLSWLGARKVYAVDYSDDACEMTKFMINFADIGNVEVVHSDIGEFNLPGKSVDGIFSIEAISHYRNYETFLDMSSRVLRDDGFLVIRDNNNGASCQIRRKNLKIWDVFENYPGKTTVFGNTKSDTCYLVMRERIIQDEFPDLSLEEIKKYARFTFAYSRERIISAVEQFIKGDFSSTSEYSYGKCPLDPETNQYMERLFNPMEVKRKLNDYGFKSRILSNGPARRDLKIFTLFWEFLSPITIFSPRGYRIIAHKIF